MPASGTSSIKSYPGDIICPFLTVKFISPDTGLPNGTYSAFLISVPDTINKSSLYCSLALIRSLILFITALLSLPLCPSLNLASGNIRTGFNISPTVGLSTAPQGVPSVNILEVKG